MMDTSKFLIVGARGQLGTAWSEKYPDAQAVDSDVLDITDAESIFNFDWSNYSTVLNAAAYTNVDGAETAEGRSNAWAVNAVGARNLAAAAQAHDLTLVHISTDYVFDGTNKNHPETEMFSPLSVYGQSKAAGDIAVGFVAKHYILRTTWVIGEGKNFVRTMLDLGSRDVQPTVVADQVGRLTFTEELTTIADHLIGSGADFGTYNATNSGEPASWADITRQIFDLAGYTQEVTETSTANYIVDKASVAPRPLSSIMDLQKLEATGYNPRDWREALSDYLKKELQT